MNYEVYISDELLTTLQIRPDEFPGTHRDYIFLTNVHRYILGDRDVELAKELIQKNTGVERVDFDGECFVAYNASEDN